MAYQKIGVFFIALVICGQASAQGPVSAPSPTSGADVPSFAPVSSPVVAPFLPPLAFIPTVAPSVPPTIVPTTETPTLAPVIPPSPVSAPVAAPAAEVPTPAATEFAPAPGPSFETSSAMTVSAAVWSILGLSSGLLVVVLA